MNNSYWLSSVEMGGYRTIKNVAVSFQPGLNIIIGKNGTGKTNFFEFLYNTLNMEFRGVSEFHTNLALYYDGNDIKFKVKGEVVKKTAISAMLKEREIKSHVFATIQFNAQEKTESRYIFEDNDLYLFELNDFLAQKGINFSEIIKIYYAIPQDIKMLNIPWWFNAKGKHFIVEGNIFDILTKFAETHHENGKYNYATMRRNLPSIFNDIYNSLTLFRNFLQQYTAIQDVRYNQGIFILEKEEGIEFSNIMYEFKINNDWFFFNDLSDGTKRLIWIIYAFLYSNAKIIFIEEPELGIHPHQLNLLMKFLKEQSKEKQIILSTHAPQCLDILKPAELERIIICEIEGKSTKLSHLDEKKKQKAKKYMEDEDILSNYWRFSDLER